MTDNTQEPAPETIRGVLLKALGGMALEVRPDGPMERVRANSGATFMGTLSEPAPVADALTEALVGILVTEEDCRRIMEDYTRDGFRDLVSRMTDKAMAEKAGAMEAAVRADERGRLRSLLPYFTGCCDGFQGVAAQMLAEGPSAEQPNGTGLPAFYSDVIGYKIGGRLYHPADVFVVRDPMLRLRDGDQPAKPAAAHVRCDEWAVFWGGSDPDECAGSQTGLAEEDAAEDAQWRIGGGVARREVLYGPWVVVTPAVDQEAAARADERRRIRELAVRTGAVVTGDEGTSCYFEALLAEPGELADPDGLNAGRPIVWSGACPPGGTVCAVPDAGRPDGICGSPVESEPCSDHAGPTPDLRLRPGDQPLPKPATGPVMHDMVIADLRRQFDDSDLAGPIIEAMKARKQLGIGRYGQPLRSNNGRDALRDLSEEIADASVYSRQVIEERRLPRGELAAMQGVYDTLLSLLFRVAEARQAAGGDLS
jgi:hypothetical protein